MKEPRDGMKREQYESIEAIEKEHGLESAKCKVWVYEDGFTLAHVDDLADTETYERLWELFDHVYWPLLDDPNFITRTLEEIRRERRDTAEDFARFKKIRRQKKRNY